MIKSIIKKIIPDKIEVKRLYKKIMGKQLNLNNPRTFNEKLQWLKLYDRDPRYTMMVDKCEAKKYVSQIIGDEYIIPTYGVWNKFEEIDFDKLPDQFVLKCTHDSGGLVVVRDKSKFDKKAAKQKIERCLKNNFFYCAREWPYKHVKPRIIAEKYMEDSSGELNDYKIMCFNGRAYCSFVCTDRFSEDGLKVTIYDRSWNRLAFKRPYPSSEKEIAKPINYEKMVEIAEAISKDISFVRIDFYECNEKLYFGEITFYPGGGFEEFEPEAWDEKLGKLIKLPEKRRKIGGRGW